MKKYIGLMVLLMAFTLLGPAHAEEAIPPLPELPVKGMVTMLTIGNELCLSCQRLKPILKELEREYQGKAAIVFIDLLKYRDQGIKYELRTVPTQIFFDASGKERYRHEGYLSKKRCVDYLRKLGVN